MKTSSYDEFPIQVEAIKKDSTIAQGGLIVQKITYQIVIFLTHIPRMEWWCGKKQTNNLSRKLRLFSREKLSYYLILVMLGSELIVLC